MLRTRAKWWVAFLAYLLGAAAPARAAGAGPAPMAKDVKTLVDRVQKFYETTQDFTAKFHQDYFYKTFKRHQISDGTVAFAKPGKMRWEYLTPSKRTFLLSQGHVYAYDPEADTITTSALEVDKLSASVTFLLGKGKLASEFSIQKTPCEKCQGTLLTLTPLEPDPRLQRVLLEVDPAKAQVLASTVVDPDGSENTIRFLELKTNVGLPAATFKLEHPASTQVIDLTSKKQ